MAEMELGMVGWAKTALLHIQSFFRGEMGIRAHSAQPTIQFPFSLSREQCGHNRQLHFEKTTYLFVSGIEIKMKFFGNFKLCVLWKRSKNNVGSFETLIPLL